jgi:hypothetical protein
MWVRILALMGIALSLYSMHVEIEKARYGDAYKPACDLTEEIKCSKVMTQLLFCKFIRAISWSLVITRNYF